MIKTFKTCYDKNNRLILPILFQNGKFLCEYNSGEKIFLSPNDMHEKIERHNEKNIISPTYIEPVEVIPEVKVEEKTSTFDIKSAEEILKNSKDNDFYSNF